MTFVFSFALRAALASASLALALAATACSSSSRGCTYTPGPDLVATLKAPCGLTFASVAMSGPCEKYWGITTAPTVIGTGEGTCTASATFTNGAHATGTVTFAQDGSMCGTFAPTPMTLTLTPSGSSGCDAGAASDAAAE